MGISLAYHMDINRFIDSIPSPAYLASCDEMADSKNYASFYLDIRESLYINISAFYSIEMQRFATGISSLPWDNYYESLFFF